MAFIQADLYGGGVHAGVGGVQRGDVVDHSDIREHHLEILGIDDLVDERFYLGHVIVGDFDAGSGGDLDVHRKLPGVGLRKEREAQEGIDGEAGHKDRQQECQRQSRGLQCDADGAFVKIEQAIELAIEPGIEAAS